MGLSVPLLYCTSEPGYSPAAAYRYMRREMNEGGVTCCFTGNSDILEAGIRHGTQTFCQSYYFLCAFLTLLYMPLFPATESENRACVRHSLGGN